MTFPRKNLGRFSSTRPTMQILCNGMISGLTIGLLALAFNVVYLPTRVLHLALGAVYAAVPFIAWQLRQWNQPWGLALLAAVTTGIVLSLICETLNHGRLERNGAKSGSHFISSLGLYIVMVE